MKDQFFKAFWRGYQLDKSTYETTIKSLSDEINYLTREKLPYSYGKDMLKVLDKIYALTKKKHQIQKRFGPMRKKEVKTTLKPEREDE